MSAVTFVTFVRLEEVGEAAEFWAVTEPGRFRYGWSVPYPAQIQLILSGTNISAVTFVTFIRLKEVGEAAELLAVTNPEIYFGMCF